ncbi:FxSxx-COOH system tetratricopeptide repeat protein [Sphaerisporangium dianthi]|uniref:FxSxx-COOH system tetratricopeptide repeat protein n=1 Tax=Sphaerisporangium dianthi TaxID=1436120 RepID=A0ABV9CDF2_9ACTN
MRDGEVDPSVPASAEEHAPRRRWLVWAGGSAAGGLAAIGTYAGVAAQVVDDLTLTQMIWTVVASVVAAVFAFLTAAAGGYALLSRHVTDRRTTAVAAGARWHIWGGIPPRNVGFTNRTEAIDRIHAVLRSESAGDDVRSCVLQGLGGVGKTSLAAEYAYRFRSEYALIWWVRAEPQAIAADDLGRLFAALTGEAVPDQVDVPARLWRELMSVRPWLLIYDDAVDRAALRKIWPVGGAGHVIITSRADAWSDLADETITVDVFSHDDAVTLLRARTRSDDRASAAEVADKLGRLPLALVQAASYVNQTKTTLEHYAELVERHPSSILATTPPADHSVPVATTWSMSITRAAAQAAGAGELLIFFSYLAPERIPRALPAERSSALPPELAEVLADPVAYDLAIAALAHYSLITADSACVSLHRLVQFAVRTSLTETARRKWLGVVIRALDQAFPRAPADRNSWATCAELAPHVFAATAHAEQIGSPEFMGDLLKRAGIYHMSRDFLQAALDLLRMALFHYERADGENALAVAEVCAELARVQHRRADLADALILAERAIRIKERHLGASAIELIGDVARLGDVLMEMSRLQDAQDAMERALSIAESGYGADDRRSLPCLRHLFWLHMRRGHYGTALAFAQRGFELDRAAEGRDERGTAYLHEDIGCVHYKLRDFEKAKIHWSLSRDMFVRIDGPESYEALKREQGVADSCAALGEYETAIDVSTHSVEGLARIVGADHPDVAAGLTCLADALSAAGRPQDALPHLTRAVAIYERFYGSGHPYLAHALVLLSATQLAVGDRGEAVRSLNRAEKIVARCHGTRHPMFAAVLQGKSELSRSSGNQREADALAEDARSILAEARNS